MKNASRTRPARNFRKMNKREASVLGKFTKQMASFMYDYSADGGAAGAYLSGIKLPANSVVTKVYTDEQTALTGSTSVTLNAGATALTAAIDFTASAGFQSPALAGAAAGIKMAAASELQIAIVGTATAGKVRFAVEFFISE